jgi:hypothetical protein
MVWYVCSWYNVLLHTHFPKMGKRGGGGGLGEGVRVCCVSVSERGPDGICLGGEC